MSDFSGRGEVGRYPAAMRKAPVLVCLAMLIALMASCNRTLEPSPTPEKEPPNNAPPAVTLEATRLEGEATFHATFQARASDPDGHQLSYAWWVNDVRKTNEEGATATLAFDEAGSFAVRVEVSDGWRTTSARVTVHARNDYRPAGSPDVVIMGFAGGCAFCTGPATNEASLGDDPYPGTLTALEETFESVGYATRTYSYRSHLYDDSAYGPGYLTADAMLRFVRDTWIGEFQNPTRVVLAAHSHGTQFMSLLAYDHPEVQFAYGIYLDAVCTFWDADHIDSGLFDSYYGSPIFYPAPLNETTHACDSLPVPGMAGLQDISDVVPWNVTWGLEVRSGSHFPYDNDPNVRQNGTSGHEVGLASVHQRWEGHTEVHTAGSRGLSWALDTITLNGLPPEVAPSQAGSRLRLAPAPPGFELDAP